MMKFLGHFWWRYHGTGVYFEGVMDVKGETFKEKVNFKNKETKRTLYLEPSGCSLFPSILSTRLPFSQYFKVCWSR